MNQRIADLTADIRSRAALGQTHAVVPIATVLALVEQRGELLGALNKATLAEDPDEWITEGLAIIKKCEAP